VDDTAAGGARWAFPAYTAAVAAAALAVLVPVVASGWSLHGRPEAFVLLAACVVAGELLPLRLPRSDAVSDDLTLSSAFALAIAMLFGPAPAVAVYAGACVVAELVERPALVKAVFNVAQYVVVMAAATGAFAAVAGHTVVESVPGDGLAIVAMGVAFFVADNVLTSVAVALLSGTSPLATFRSHLSVHTPTEASLLALAPVIAASTREASWLVPLLLIPMAAILVGGRHAAATWRRALYDDVTGLPNRALVTRRIAAKLDEEASCGVAVVAVDGLEAVGDALGAASLDSVTALVGQRLRAAVGDEEWVARVGGSQFCVVSDGDDLAHALSGAIRAAFGPPFEVGDLSIPLRAHAGVAWATDGASAPDLVARAGAAADGAAALGETVVEAPAEEQRPIDRLILAGQLQRGIARGELFLKFQPKRALHDGVPDAAEALVRWNHPDLGPLAPQAFVPLAERTGLIGALTRWVSSEAVRQCSEWLRAGVALRVAVNVSARDVVDAAFAEHLEHELQRWDVPAGMVQLEITETQIVADASEAQRALARLARAGVSCAIDDFGTGYSSLAQLQRLDVDEIKIDRSFVQRLDEDAANVAIVRSTVGLARNLGLSVTAEGVESRAVLEQLRELGCDYAQGYHVGKPMPPAACLDALHGVRAAATPPTRRFRAVQASLERPV
jgi:diguanylate cyclase (GGDEF)-like protein